MEPEIKAEFTAPIETVFDAAAFGLLHREVSRMEQMRSGLASWRRPIMIRVPGTERWMTLEEIKREFPRS